MNMRLLAQTVVPAPPESLFDNPVFWLMSVGVIAMATVVGVFWKIIHASNVELKAKHEALEEKRETDRENMITISSKVGQLEGKVHLAEGLHPKMDEVKVLVNQVLEHVADDQK